MILLTFRTFKATHPFAGWRHFFSNMAMGKPANLMRRTCHKSADSFSPNAIKTLTVLRDIADVGAWWIARCLNEAVNQRCIENKNELL